MMKTDRAITAAPTPARLPRFMPLVLLGSGVFLVLPWLARGATWQEDFAEPPAGNGWEILGHGELFAWNAEDEAVHVTWDSSKENSYFYKPLGTLLARADDFSFAFDLLMDDIAIGVNPAKPYTFQLAVGLIRRGDAIAPDFFRGAGINAAYGPRNLVEFDYFPDSGFGDTFAPTVVSTNNRIVFSDNHPLTLTLGDRFRIRMEYAARDAMLRTTVTRNGEPYGLPPGQGILDLPLPESMDFRVDGFAVCSYNDGQQFPEMFAGSLLAHGRVDNIEVTVPDPPVRALTGRFQQGAWQVSFPGRSNWWYILERTAALEANWDVIAAREGTTGTMILTDDDPPAEGTAFYRVRAER